MLCQTSLRVATTRGTGPTRCLLARTKAGCPSACYDVMSVGEQGTRRFGRCRCALGTTEDGRPPRTLGTDERRRRKIIWNVKSRSNDRPPSTTGSSTGGSVIPIWGRVHLAIPIIPSSHSVRHSTRTTTTDTASPRIPPPHHHHQHDDYPLQAHVCACVETGTSSAEALHGTLSRCEQQRAMFEFICCGGLVCSVFRVQVLAQS